MLQGRLRFVVLCCVMFVLCMIWPTYANTIPRPYIHPLRSSSDYLYVDYYPVEEQAGAIEFSWADEEDEQVYYVWGNQWDLGVADTSLDGLRSHLDTLSANILYDSGDFLIATVDGPDGVWWACAELYGSQYEVTVVQETEPPELPEEDEYEDEYEEEYEYEYDGEYVGEFEEYYYEDEYDGEYEEDYYEDEYDEDYDEYDDEEYYDDENGKDYADSGYEEHTEFIMPLINPLGDIEAYSSLHYAPADIIDIIVYNANGERFSFKGWGDRWHFDVPIEGRNAFADLAKYIQNLGGEIVENSPGVVVGKVVDQNGYLWTAIAEGYDESAYVLNVAKEMLLVPGKTLVIKPKPGQDTYGLTAESDGSRFRSLIVELNDGECYLSAVMESEYGDYTYESDLHFQIQAYKTPIFILDSINQLPGKTVFVFRVYEESVPEQISVTLEESVPLQPVKMGEQLGILKIIGADPAEITVESSLSAGYSHPDIEQLVGDVAADGSHVFYLPAGYWDVTLFVPNYNFVTSRMVPVSSGEITVLQVPSATHAVFTELTENIEQEVSPELIRHVVKGGQGEVDFTLPAEFPGHLVPSIDNLEISEGGLMGEVISVEPLTSPPEIVLLLDSSGSMRPQMEQTLVTARQFLSSLGGDTFIQVVDFDTIPKLLHGTAKDEVLASLASVRADGATCLYDSIMMGLELLQEKNRPVLVVFTDGVDANWDDTGPGSVATLPEVIAAVQGSQIPLYTIGFGEGHDKTVLQQLASISGGKYFPAADQNALSNVFESINQTLSNNYRVVYERPKEPQISNVPVVTIMVDTSGSMDAPPEEEGCGWRMQKVKNVLHDFILNLPEQTLLQVGDFAWFTVIQQSMTLDKAQALNAVGILVPGGATDIEGSMSLAYQTLSATPSQNKVLVYITDAALNTEIDPDTYYWLLDAIAKSDIKAIWIGVGMEDEEAVFAEAAQRSQGRYVVTEESQDITAMLEQVLAEMKEAVADSTDVEVRLSIKEPLADKIVHRYTGTMKVLAVKLAQGDTVIGPAAMEVYSAGSAADVSEMQSYGLNADDLQTRFIPLDAKASNTAVEVTVSGVTVSNYLQGLMAPQGWQFVSISTTLQNILEPQEVIVDAKGSSHPASWMGGGASGKKEYRVPDYLIPGLSSHLYLGWNNNSMYPVSKASWLAADSLLIPGDMSLTVKPGEPLSGSLVFLVEDQYLSQASLHFYDTAYGHFSLDLIGTGSHSEFTLEAHPAEAPMRLSDAFEIHITAVDDLDQIGSVAANELNVFRVVELDLTSKVQALLDINPQEVFSLRIQTDKGHAFIPVSLEATMSMPLGFGEARMVAPGSFNKMRFVFEIPREFAANPCELFVDLRQDDLFIPLVEGEIALDFHAVPVSAEGIELYLNQVGYVSHHGSLGSDLVVADVTFVDHPDDFGTVLEGCFKLVRDDFAGAESEFDIGKLVASQGLGSFGDPDDGEVFYVLAPSSITDELVLGFGDPVVKDGMARRAVVVFAIPSDGQDHTWTLQSDLFPGLNVPVPKTGYTETALLGFKTQARADSGIMEFAQQLDVAINGKVSAYQERQAAKGQLARHDLFDLDGEVEQEESITPPRVNLAGKLELEGIASVDGLMALLRDLRWVPSKDTLETWQPRYAPEAVLTQRWGTEADLANLAISVLDQLGYKPERTIVDLQTAGREALAQLAGVSTDRIQLEHLPAVKYQADGEAKLLVIPFMADVAELEDYVAIPIRYVQFRDYPITAQIEVVLSVMPKGSGFSDQFSDFATILAGGDDEDLTESYLLLNTSLPLPDLSLDAVDLVYVPAGYDGGDLYTVILESASGKVVGDTINTADYHIEAVEIWISTGYETYRHKTVLQENQVLDQVAHTIAINAPDLPSAAAEQLQAVAEALHGSAANPDSLSVFKWYTRSIINRFVAEQTLIEHDLAEKLDLVIGRTYQPRVIIVTVAQDPANQSVKTSIDLAGAANDVHSGDPQAISAFNVGTGLAASVLEAKVIGGIGVFELWQGLPDDVPVIWISDENKYTALEVLQELGYSKSIQQYVEEINNKVLAFPLATVMINGSPEIAWLEIDRDTYFTIGVLASGEHGAMLESAVQNYLKNFTKYAVGAVMGMHSMVWGVATFSLECDDYGVVLEAAAAQAIDIAYDIKNAIEELAKWDPRQVAGIMEKVESKAMGLINDMGGAAMDEAVERIKAHWEGIVDEQKKELLPDISFVGGMLDAIEVYVILAQK